MKIKKTDKRVLETIATRRAAARKHHKHWKIVQRKQMQFVRKDDRQKVRDSRRAEKEYRSYEKLEAPTNFSLNDNTEEVVAFISKIEDLYQARSSVYINLRSVEEIDYGSIVSLLSIMIQFRRKKIKFNGNFPRNHYCEEKLRKSGFIYNLYKNAVDDERYCISNGADNSAITHAWRKVDTKLSSEIVKESTMTIWGVPMRCQGVQRCIGELMLNTNNHAEIGTKGVKNWWLYINHDKDRQTVSFAFVDFGVGIFESLKNKPSSSKFYGWWEKIVGRIIHGDNSSVLKLIMTGEFHRTVTGKYYRGKGLPGIGEALKRNQLSNLLILSNDAFGDVGNGAYKTLNSFFNGTYVYWELNRNNEYCE